MLPNSWHNISFLRPLVEILQTLEVCKVLLFVSSFWEGDGNVFAGNPFVKVVFDLIPNLKWIQMKKSTMSNWTTQLFQYPKPPSQPTLFLLKLHIYPHTGISLSTITTDATGFLAALKTYIRRAYPPPALPLLPTSADSGCFDVYKRLSISQPPLAAVGRETYIDRIRAESCNACS